MGKRCLRIEALPGLSPVNAITLQSGEKPYRCTKYGDTEPYIELMKY